MGNMKILNTNTAIYTIELHEAKVVPFKKLEQAWTRTNGDKAKQAKLIKKYDLKTLISKVRPGSIKLGVMNKLNHVNGNATAAGTDLDGELIFITNNPLKIIYPKKSSRRPEGAEIEEADNGAIVEEKVEEKKSLNTLRLEKVASIAIKEDDQCLIEAFVKSETFSIDSSASEIKEAYKIFEASADWIIYDKKTGKQLSPSKSWRKWQGAKMAAAKIGGNAEPADAAWYHDNKAKLLGEAVAPKKLDTEINAGPFDSKQKNSILSIIKMLPGKITGNSKATDVNGGGQLGVEIDGKVYVWFTMSVLGHAGSVELKPDAGKKRSTNSKDFKNIAGGSGQKALVAYVKELLSMNEATDLNEVSAGKLALLDTQQLMTFYTIFSRVNSPRGKDMTKKLKRELSKRDDFNESTDLEEAITLKDVIRGSKAVGRGLKKSASIAKVFLKATIAVSKKVGGAIGELMSDPEFQAIFKKYSEDPTDERSLRRAQMYLDPKFGDSQSPHFSESTDLEEASATVQSVLKALELKGGKDASALIKKMRDLGLESKVSRAHAAAAKKILKGQITKFVKESEDEGHYTADGKEWTGDQHEVDGQVMTGKVHSDDSVDLYHFKELTPEVRKQVAASFK